MSQAVLVTAAKPLIKKSRAIYKLLQRMEKLAGRSGLAALRRELQVGMGWCHEVVEVLRQAEGQIPGKADDGQG